MLRKYVRRSVAHFPKLANTLLRVLLSGHTTLYRVCGKLASVVEGGVHPKHRLLLYESHFIDRVTAGERVIDIGCSDGMLTRQLDAKGARTTGIDIDGEAIARARKRGGPRADYRVGDARQILPNWSSEDRVDVIVLSNVLEHIEDRPALLTVVAKITSRLLIRVPRRDRDWITLYKREQGVEWRLDRTHCTEYTVDELAEDLRLGGFDLTEYRIAFDEIWAEARRSAAIEK